MMTAGAKGFGSGGLLEKVALTAGRVALRER